MDLYKTLTTRPPLPPGVTTNTSTLQRNITIYVLVTGIAGGLLLVLAILLLCKHCAPCKCKLLSRIRQGWTPRVANSTSKESQYPNRHLPTNDADPREKDYDAFVNEHSSTNSRTTQEGSFKSKRSLRTFPPAATSSAVNNSAMDPKDAHAAETSACVIQVEPIRVIAATPVDEPWPSLCSSEAHDQSMLNVKTEAWSVPSFRHSFSSHSSGSQPQRSRKNSSESYGPPTSTKTQPSEDLGGNHFKRSLKHAASHPSSKESDLTVSKRRQDWRKSHRNYRSTPSSTNSKDYSVSYEARRALRDSVGQSTRSPTSSAKQVRRSHTERGDCNNSRRTFFKRGGSMREYSPNGGPPYGRARTGTRDSPSTKRWRCHTVDGDPPNPLNENGLLSVHRHSFPCGEKREEKRSHSRSITRLSSEERTDSPEWTPSHPKPGFVAGLKEATRAALRYNDPGSLESVHEESLVFCLEAEDKLEFHQRLRKTIHAQYRELWELRATLEDRSDFSDRPSSPDTEDHAQTLMPRSFTTSFESTEDPVIGEEDTGVTSPAINYLMKPECKDFLSPSAAKRQSYRSTLNSRIRRTPATSPTATVLSPGQQGRTGPGQSSFDSIDTVETSASSTDASRLEHVTTSFESSATADTTTTDSTTGEVSSSSTTHRLFTSRGDSGYRSLEVSYGFRHPSKLGASLATTVSIEEDEICPSGRLVDSVNECQCESDTHDDKCERNKPVIFARCTRYGLAKTRTAASANCGKFSWRTHLTKPLLTRDFSIDERTDAIFREFSRCDPALDRRTGWRDARQATFNKRWQLRHERRLQSSTHDSIATDSSETLMHSGTKD